MIHICTDSDLKNKSLEAENIEMKLDEADHEASLTTERLSHDEVFRSVKALLQETE